MSSFPSVPTKSLRTSSCSSRGISSVMNCLHPCETSGQQHHFDRVEEILVTVLGAIVAGAAEDFVHPRPAEHLVVPAAADERVTTAFADQDIVVAAAHEDVIAGVALDRVG